MGDLVQGAAAADWGLRRWTRIADWLRDVVVLPYDFNVATTWGLMSGSAKRRGHPRPVNDTWTAAVYVVNELPLATRNVKDFEPYVQYSGLVLAQIACPTLVIAAADDRAVPSHHARMLHDQIRGSQLVIIHGADHALIWTHPDDFLRVTEEFLEAD